MGKTQVRFLFLAAIAAVVAAVLIVLDPSGGGKGEPPSPALAAPGPGDTVNAGYDLFETEGGTTDLLGISLGPGFFGPGSDPFDGQVYLEGVPFDDYTPQGGPTYYGLLPTDTIVERRQDAGEEGFPDDIEIEIVALNLKSVDPITVTYGEDPSQQWDVTVEVPENDPYQTLGSMTVRHEYATGGTFDSYLPVDPLLTFTEVGGPGSKGPYYHSAITGGPIEFSSSDVPWNHTANPLASPAGHWVIVKEGLTSNFFPGIDGTSGALYKGYFGLDAPLIPAHHSVQPAELPLSTFGTTVGDCSNRPSEIATGTDVFRSTATMEIYLDAWGPMAFDLEGDTTVERSPDPEQPGVIDIEIIEMSLVATAPIEVSAGSGLGLSDSTGEIASSSGYDDFPADSFFDVYVEIDDTGTGGGIYHNNEPVRMEASLLPDLEGIVCLPPYEIPYVASNLPVTLYEGETDVGTLDDFTLTPEPARSITVVKLDEETEEPLPGAVFTLHRGTDCDNPALGAATTDETGVGDLGPMGGGMYSVKEAIAPVGSGLPPDPCTDVDHTTPYDDLEITKGGPDTMGGLDRFPTAAKVIMDITEPLIGPVTVLLNGLTEVERLPLHDNFTPGDPSDDYIETEIISMNLVGEHPIAGTVTLREHAVQHSYGTVINPIIDDQGTPEPEDDILIYGDSFFDVYVEVDVPSIPMEVENLAPVPMQAHIEGIPPELAFFQPPGPIAVDMFDRAPPGDPRGIMTYALHITLPRGEKAVIMQDPPGPPVWPPQEISYSIEFNSFSNINSPYFHAADILVPPGPTPVRTCASLGLSTAGCALASPQDDLNSLSYGFDFSSADPAEPPKVFSVDPASLGLLGTDVDIEVTCSGGPEAHADLFRTPLDGTNQQEFDGNGVAGGPGCLASYPLGLVEPSAPSAGDNLNALGELPTGDPVYFTLAPNSPSLLPVASGGLGLCGGSSCTSAHIFKSTGGVVSIYATPAELGLVSSDIVNALALRESDGQFDVNPADGVFDSPPDLLQFSLDPGSPTLGPSDSAADQFKPKTTVGGLPVLVTPANAHGLMNAADMGPHGDNLDAIKAPYLDSDGDLVPDPIDPDPGIPTGYFDDGTISGSITGNVTVTDLTNSVLVEAPMGGGGGGVFATCPATGSSDETLITLSLAEGEIATLGCESSASVTIVNGPAGVAFGPFTATVPTGSKVIILDLPDPAPGPCPGVTVPAGAYQITHSVGTLNVTIWSGSMSTVTLPPGGVYRDCDGDAIFGVVDNCTDDSNPPQTNTDVDLAVAGAALAVGVPLVGDTLGDICDVEDDNESGANTQDPGAPASTCPDGTIPLWSDCVEDYLGTEPLDNCTDGPGPGGDAYPPDTNVDGKVNIVDVGQMAPYWRQDVDPPPTVDPGRRFDLNADGKVNIVDVGKMAPSWRDDCS